ncbi:MAG: alkane 1-monooxygenase [Bacteriovoracaceae bacterium]|nr:alkane 1-monooxygenase [Bacteriovoracaceae bacterium]
MNYLLRLSPFALLGACWLGNVLGGYLIALGPIVVYGLHPLLDNLIGNRIKNDDGPSSVQFLNITLYILPLFILGFLVHGFVIFEGLSSFSEKLLLIVSIGTGMGGLGITAAHELVHRPVAWQRGLGVFLLALVNYTYFRIEHVHGHHKYVSTPEDPASAPFGMNLYEFLPKSLLGSIKSANDYEKKRLKRRTPLRQVLDNRNFHYLIYAILLTTMSFLFMGLQGIAFFWGQSIVAIFMLETINYIEHYGLERKKLPNGNWEPVKEWHSWDCDYAVTNFSLYNIGKHSNHHARASVEFPYLENKEENPKLSFGYSSAIILAIFPPLWKKIMDPEVIKRRELYSS